MNLISVSSALLSCTPEGVITITAYNTDSRVVIDNLEACNSIDFEVVLSTGHTGGGTIEGSSRNTTGGGEKYVLESDSILVDCTLEGANPPVVVATIEVSNAGQESVYAD